ncbi:unnamed protein product, partial [marine sediment metagenome]
ATLHGLGDLPPGNPLDATGTANGLRRGEGA